MPPFGDEPREKVPKPLAFLNLSHASAKSGTQRGRPRSVFGAEPAEAVDETDCVGRREVARPPTKPASKRPFQDEGCEDGDCQGRRKLTFPKSSTSHPTLFGDEGSEDDAASDGDSSSNSGAEGFAAQQNTVFTFGWSSVSTFQKATTWREQIDDPKASREKRAYDNSKRAQEASYSKQESTGFYKRNGLDPARLQKLFAATTCSCAFVGILL